MVTMISLLALSWTTLFPSAATAILVWEVLWIIYCKTLHPLANIPGPFLASFSRTWIWWTVRHGQMHTVQMELHAKYGRLIRIAPNELSCSDPAAVKEVYRTQNPLEKSDFYTVWQNTSFGHHKDNFSVTDEKEHASRRRIVNPIYSMSNVLKSEAYVDQCSSLFVQKLGDLAERGQSFDLGEWLQMYAFDVIGELYFGRIFGFMETGQDCQSLMHSLDVLNPVMASLAVSATYARPFVRALAIASHSIRSALKGIDYITKTSKAVVLDRENELRAAEAGGKLPRQDLLQQLMGIVQGKGTEVDFGIAEAQYEAYVAVFAGADITAIAMRSVFYHLSRSPHALTALRSEIDDAFPVSKYPLDMPIPYADAIKLPLLCATIKEAMRLHPSVAFTMPRVSPSPDGLTIDGKFILPGYRIGLNPYIVHRDKSVFGEDADIFRPDRWLPENTSADQIREMDRCMLHFGAGTRTCIGKNMSLSEMHKFISQVLRNFEFTPTDENGSWTHNNFWFNKQTGLNFSVERRVGKSD